MKMVLICYGRLATNGPLYVLQHFLPLKLETPRQMHLFGRGFTEKECILNSYTLRRVQDVPKSMHTIHSVHNAQTMQRINQIHQDKTRMYKPQQKVAK